jgi:hypothetical protein
MMNVLPSSGEPGALGDENPGLLREAGPRDP